MTEFKIQGQSKNFFKLAQCSPFTFSYCAPFSSFWVKIGKCILYCWWGRPLKHWVLASSISSKDCWSADVIHLMNAFVSLFLFLHLGELGVGAHLVWGFPSAKLLPEEPADQRDAHRHPVPLPVLDGPRDPQLGQDPVGLPQVNWRIPQIGLTHWSSADFRQISTLTIGFYPKLVLSHPPLYILYSVNASLVRLPFAPMPFGVLENRSSNKDCVSVLSLSSWAYSPHLPPAHVMQQINSPALPGLALEEKKKKKPN